LELGEDAGACSDFSTGWPGIAVLPGSAHLLKIPIEKIDVILVVFALVVYEHIATDR